MATLAVTELKSGMTLSADLVAPNGRFILPEGACLTPKNIMSFKIWGISEVPVADFLKPKEVSETFWPAGALEDAREKIRRVFGGEPPESRGMKAIYHAGMRGITGWQEGACAFSQKKSTVFFDPGKVSSEQEETCLSLEELIEKEVRLVSFPEVYFRISEALQCPKSSMTHIANLISKDTALSAALLKLANSAMYGVPAKVDSIARAAALIGGNALSLLALGVSVATAFGSVPVQWVDMESFWKHSLTVGVFAQVLGARKIPRAIERLFVGGMLHDVGRLVLLRRAPLGMAQAIARAEEREVPLWRTEREIWGFDHAELGGKLLEKWGFPRSLTDLVEFHHDAEKQEESFSLGVLGAADVLAGAFLSGSSGSPRVSGISDEVWDMMDLSPEVLDMVVRQARRQITEVYSLFKGGVGGGTGVPRN